MPTNNDTASDPGRSHLAELRRAVAVPDLGERVGWAALYLLATAVCVAIGLSAGPTSNAGLWLAGVLLLIFSVVPLLLSVYVLRYGRPVVDLRI